MNLEINDEDFGKNSIKTHNAFICTDDGIHLIGSFDMEYAVEALMNLVENKTLREQFAEKGVDIIKKVHPSMIFKQWKTIIKNI